jgi:integrase
MALKVRSYRGQAGVWEVDIRVRLPSGETYRERRKFSGSSKTLAKEWGEKRIAHVLQNGVEAAKPKKEVPTVSEFQEQFISWLQANKRKAATIITAKCAMRRYVVPAFGERRLDSFKQSDVEALKVRCSHLAPGSLQGVLDKFRVMLKAAKSLGHIEEMPRVDPVKVGTKTAPHYDPADYERLIDAAAKLDPRILAMVLLCGDAGLRRGEVIALSWKHVDDRTRTLRIEEAVYVTTLDTTKGARARVLRMSARLHAALRSLGRQLPGTRVLRADGNTRVTHHHLYAWMREATTAAGLAEQDGIHILRHTHGTMLAAAGVRPRAIMSLMGHSSINMATHYMHLIEGAERDAIEALESLSERARMESTQIDERKETRE